MSRSDKIYAGLVFLFLFTVGIFLALHNGVQNDVTWTRAMINIDENKVCDFVTDGVSYRELSCLNMTDELWNKYKELHK